MGKSLESEFLSFYYTLIIFGWDFPPSYANTSHRGNQKAAIMGDKQTLDELETQLKQLTTEVQQLSKQALNAKDSLSSSYRSMDQATNKLRNYKKQFAQAKSTISQIKKAGVDVNALEESANQVQPLIKDLNQRLAPATGR
jgi:chromosome segregation ATPase